MIPCFASDAQKPVQFTLKALAHQLISAAHRTLHQPSPTAHLLSNGALVLHIALVAQDHLLHVFARVRLDVADPLPDVLERLLACDVCQVVNECAVRESVGETSRPLPLPAKTHSRARFSLGQLGLNLRQSEQRKRAVRENDKIVFKVCK